jgi:uncharacterized protein
MLKNLLPPFLALLCALAPPIARADSPRTIKWNDLLPELSADHPFARLTRFQAVQLGQIATLRGRQAAGEKLSAVELADLKRATRNLKKASVDVDGLLAKRQEIIEKNQAQAQSVNPALDGQLVRMPAYLLPLEFSGKDVSEFLLVPWVGACIHTPPPPPNQIVHVKADKPVGNVGMFMPIWVTGRMSTKASKTNLYLVDGASDIDAGYSLLASQVEPYKQ